MSSVKIEDSDKEDVILRVELDKESVINLITGGSVYFDPIPLNLIDEKYKGIIIDIKGDKEVSSDIEYHDRKEGKYFDF